MNRREFLQQTTAAAGLIAASATISGCSNNHTRTAGTQAKLGSSKDSQVAIVSDRADAVVSAAPGQWGIGRLREALNARGMHVLEARRIEELPAGVPCIVAAGR